MADCILFPASGLGTTPTHVTRFVRVLRRQGSLLVQMDECQLDHRAFPKVAPTRSPPEFCSFHTFPSDERRAPSLQVRDLYIMDAVAAGVKGQRWRWHSRTDHDDSHRHPPAVDAMSRQLRPALTA